MQMAVKAIYHDHCYHAMPVKQGATSFLFPSVSGLNTRIQGGKVVVVTSPDLPPGPADSVDRPEEEELNEGIAHDHGYYHSTSGSEESQDEKPPDSVNNGESLITFDLPQPNKSGSAIAFGPTSSNMSFPDCQFSALPAQIFAQDEEEGTSVVALADGHPAAKLEVNTESLVSPHPPEHTMRLFTKEAVESKKKPRKTSITVVKPPPPESAPPTRKGTRHRKPSTKVKEMLEEVEEKKSPTRKRKAVINIARPELVPYTPTESEINTTTIHTILKSLPTALKERSRLTEDAVDDSDLPEEVKPKKMKKVPEGNAPQKATPKKPGARKRKKEEQMEDESEPESPVEEPLPKEVVECAQLQPTAEVSKIKPKDVTEKGSKTKAATSSTPMPEAHEDELEPEQKLVRRGRLSKSSTHTEAPSKDPPNKKTPAMKESDRRLSVSAPDVTQTETPQRGSRRRTQSIADQVQDVIKDIKQVDCDNSETLKGKTKTVKCMQDVVGKEDSESIAKDEAQVSPIEPKKRGRGRPPKQKSKSIEETSPSVSDVKTRLPKSSPDSTPTARSNRISVSQKTPQGASQTTKPESTPKKLAPPQVGSEVDAAVSNRQSTRQATSSKTKKSARFPDTTPGTSRSWGKQSTPQPLSAPPPAKPASTPKRSRKRKVTEESSAVEEEGSEVLTIRFIPNGDVSKNGNHWGSAIPSDLLLRVFTQVIAVEGPMPFMSRLSKVCRLWYEVGQHPSLWSRVDLSLPCVRKFKKSLTWLCRHRMAATTDLNLCGWTCLTDADLEIVVRQCRALQTINLSGCNKLSSASVYTLADHCKQLTSVDLSEAWPSSGQHDKSFESLCYLAEVVGTRLRSLSLGTNAMVQTENILDALMLHCPNLEQLDLSNCLFGNYLLKLPLERLQEACPNIRHLLFGRSLFQVKEPTNKELAKCPGFAHLETLDISRNSTSASKLKHVTDDVLKRFLRNAFDLKQLNLGGCRHITSEGIDSLPIVSLKTLGLAHCRAVTQPSIVDVILKWGFSLQDLDLSGNSVDEQIVLRLVDGCPNLRRLDLSGCRGLPWALRHEHSGDSVIITLRATLIARSTDT